MSISKGTSYNQTITQLAPVSGVRRHEICSRFSPVYHCRDRPQRGPGDRGQHGVHQPGPGVLRGGAGHRREELQPVRGLQAPANSGLQHGLLCRGGRPLPLRPGLCQWLHTLRL